MEYQDDKKRNTYNKIKASYKTLKSNGVPLHKITDKLLELGYSIQSINWYYHLWKHEYLKTWEGK